MTRTPRQEYTRIRRRAAFRGWTNAGMVGLDYAFERGLAPRQSAKWNDREDYDLWNASLSAETPDVIARRHGRAVSAIQMRIPRCREGAKRHLATLG
jgi:hypothetical protein